MLDDNVRAEFDQQRATIIETIPPLLWGFFNRCKEQGFTEEQAFDLTKEELRCISGD